MAMTKQEMYNFILNEMVDNEEIVEFCKKGLAEMSIKGLFKKYDSLSIDDIQNLTNRSYTLGTIVWECNKLVYQGFLTKQYELVGHRKILKYTKTSKAQSLSSKLLKIFY